MAATAAINTTYPMGFDSAYWIVFGTITLSGNYGTSTSHGDTVDLSVLGVPATGPPVFVNVVENAAAGASQSGWVYAFNVGSTQKNGVLQAFGSGTSGQGLAEYTEASAYASATPAIPTTLYFQAVFAKL